MVIAKYTRLPVGQLLIYVDSVIVLLGLGVFGLLFMPLRGRVVESAYTNRMLKIQARYIETLSKAADKQVDYGMRLRRDAIQPLTRLIEAQTEIQIGQMRDLQNAEQEMVNIEKSLTALGKRRLLG